jgi:hypothetical protein
VDQVEIEVIETDLIHCGLELLERLVVVLRLGEVTYISSRGMPDSRTARPTEVSL